MYNLVYGILYAAPVARANVLQTNLGYILRRFFQLQLGNHSVGVSERARHRTSRFADVLTCEFGKRMILVCCGRLIVTD